MNTIYDKLRAVGICDESLLKLDTYDGDMQAMWSNCNNLYNMMLYLMRVGVDIHQTYLCLCDIIEYVIVYCEQNRLDNDVMVARDMFTALQYYNETLTTDSNKLKRTKLKEVRLILQEKEAEYNNRNMSLLRSVSIVSSISIDNRDLWYMLGFRIFVNLYDALGGKNNQNGQQDLRNIIRTHFPIVPIPEPEEIGLNRS
jgi:hypothetical protein